MVYPYGGVQDSNRFEIWMKKNPLKFKKAYTVGVQLDSEGYLGSDKIITKLFRKARLDSLAGFERIKFDSVADFGGAQFDSIADITYAQYDSMADFRRTKFYSLANFGYVQFARRAYFGEAQFYSITDFKYARFKSRAYFGEIHFKGLTNFMGSKFDSLAQFVSAKFESEAYFKEAKFHSQANFERSIFYSKADFSWATFDSLADFGKANFFGLVDFRRANFKNKANFNSAIFKNQLDFREANIDSIVDFSLASISDTIWVGIPNSSKWQKYDFMRSKLAIRAAKIILCGPVDLKIQIEKFKFISLWDKLDYFSKKDIISTLKDLGFKEDKYNKEKFELNYIFEKSTKYQVKSTVYTKNKWYRFQLWPKWIKNFIYYITMGLGYRPFWLAWWVLGLIICFAIFYFFKMRDSINGYILKKFEMKESSSTKRKKDVIEVCNISRTESLMNCLYFSSMLLFSFRLKGEILTFFKLKEKRIIVGEYLLGLLIYIAFLTLAKSGSILHNLRSLFVG